MLAALMIVRRVGEYAFVRPGREMLFAPLDALTKYKAKNFIDTVVYRGGDAVSARAKALLDLLSQGALLAALVGAACAAAWAALGWYLGGKQTAPQAQAEPRSRGQPPL
jgi:AAA family ATP:ADP antiporter